MYSALWAIEVLFVVFVSVSFVVVFDDVALLLLEGSGDMVVLDPLASDVFNEEFE